VIMGMYTPEELAGGDGVVVDDTGEVIDVVAKEVTPEPERAEPEAPKPEKHWIDSQQVRGRFWAWCYNTMTLTEAQVYEALGVEHVHDYTGTMQDAKSAIEAWVAEQQDDDPADIPLEHPERMNFGGV